MKRLLSLLAKYNYVLVFLLLESLAIVLLSNHNHYQHTRIVNFSREITGWVNQRFEGIEEYLALRKTNEQLVQENTRLRNQLERLRSAGGTDTLHGLARTSYQYQRASVVQRTAYRQFNYITIDKGRKQGVYRDMGVISSGGIVGIVLESSANFATIIPVINRDFHLSAKIRKNQYTGIIEWNGRSPRTASLNEIPYHVELQTGDTIVTSGYSAIFPEGLFVGTIEDYSLEDGNFYEIRVSLGTNFLKLQHVNVISNFFREEQLELENQLNQ